MFSVAVTVTGIVAVLIVHAHEDVRFGASSPLADPRMERLNQVLMVFTVALVALAAVNALLITWAMVVDARRSSAVARASARRRGRSVPGCPGRRCCPRWSGPCSASLAVSGW